MNAYFLTQVSFNNFISYLILFYILSEILFLEIILVILINMLNFLAKYAKAHGPSISPRLMELLCVANFGLRHIERTEGSVFDFTFVRASDQVIKASMNG